MTAVFSEGVFSMSNGINPCTKKPEEDRKRSYVKSILFIILYLFLLNSHLFLSS